MSGTVHVVDDDAGIRDAIARLLRIEGYEAICSRDGAEFLARGPDAGPSCVLLDLALPGGIDGLEVQRRMARAGDLRSIVFLTGSSELRPGVSAMKAGAVDYLTKPVDAGDLLRAVVEALRRDAEVRARRSAADEARSRLALLSAREREVLVLVVAGMPNKRIGMELGIAEKTVKIHRGRVMQKMRADSLAELVRMADAAGIARARPGA